MLSSIPLSINILSLKVNVARSVIISANEVSVIAQAYSKLCGRAGVTILIQVCKLYMPQRCEEIIRNLAAVLAKFVSITYCRNEL